jgi:hypothetical protein
MVYFSYQTPVSDVSMGLCDGCKSRLLCITANGNQFITSMVGCNPYRATARWKTQSMATLPMT